MIPIPFISYIAGFFFLTTIAMTGFAIYRGEVNNALQEKLIDNQGKQIKVVIQATEFADLKGKEVQTVINNNEIQKEVTIREVDRIVKEPIYLTTCFDSSGMSELTKAISTPIASEPE